MRLRTCQECVGSSPKVSRACPDGTREFARRRPRLVERLSRVAEKLAGSSDDEVGSRRKLLGDSSKELGSSLGTRREIAGKKTRGLAVRLPKVVGLSGS
ncbi:hypothetical protein B296_00029381 [Ensete ventricosum]|uniref:Uncharacterized protein n=1 Tax=Ensete ventricosum TaxID=4639 RepID=A0A426Y6L7_ENSVE|nr:hypothetical protein B296_00029381 [Ensete ventricosum]